MGLDIVYTAGARPGLRRIYEYIANDLCVPETAIGQTRRIMKGIRSLGEMRCVTACMTANRGTAGD